jgi:sec-independent protein translocase protein TatC
MTAPDGRADAPPPDRGEMPFLDHLEELRWRLIRSLLAVAAGLAAGWILVTRVDVVGFLKRPIAPYLPAGGRLLFTTPMEPFMLTLKLAFVSGLLFASPVVLWQVWGFLRPALYRQERRVVVPVALAGVGLFVGGAAAAFYLVLPLALRFLFGFQSEALAPMITADAYFGFTTTLLLSFGLVFELPLVLLLLVYLRILSAAVLRKHRRLAFVLNAVIAALVSPGDFIVVTAAVLVPLQLLYEISILLAEVVERRAARPAAADAPAPSQA